MAMEVTDEMLRKLTQEWVNSIPAQYPEPEHPHHFSLRFHLRMLPLFWRAWRMENEKEKTPLPMRGGRMAAALACSCGDERHRGDGGTRNSGEGFPNGAGDI